MSHQAKPPIVHPDGSVEWQCLGCREPLLLFKGDPMVVRVGDGGEVEGILCEPCARESNQGDAKDGR